MIGSSDEELVARVIADRDTAAFGELVRRHQSRLRNWLHRLTGDPVQSDDLAQDSFILAWDKINSFSGKGRFVSWLMKIAYNNFLQSHRKRVRDKQYIDSLNGTVESSYVDEPELTDLYKMLAVLTIDERLVLTLCYGHNLSHGDIADITEIPLGTVKSHIRRSNIKIREHIHLYK